MRISPDGWKVRREFTTQVMAFELLLVDALLCQACCLLAERAYVYRSEAQGQFACLDT